MIDDFRFDQEDSMVAPLLFWLTRSLRKSSKPDAGQNAAVIMMFHTFL